MSGQLMLVNPKRRPKKRAKTTAKKRVTRRRISTRTARSTRRRRNPIRRRSAGGMKGVMNMLMPAATAATGALGLDIIWAKLPIPDTLKTGPMRHVAKAAGAVGLGMLAAMVVKKSTADQFAAGALTVTIHKAMAEGMATFAPNIQLGEYLNGYQSVGYWGSGVDPSFGEYMPGDGPGANLNAYDYETYQV